jgi:hypothetical protein
MRYDIYIYMSLGGKGYTPTCFGISKCYHQGFRYEYADMVPNVVKSTEGWELYIVTDAMHCLSQYTAPILLCFSRHWAPSQHVHIGFPADGILKCRNM